MFLLRTLRQLDTYNGKIIISKKRNPFLVNCLPTISQMYTVTSILRTFMDNQAVSYATGFFYEHNEHLYLVTNKHVIYGANYGQNAIVPTPQINKLQLRLHTNRQNSSLNEAITIDLFEQEKRIWFEHRYTDVDVVLIPLTIDETRYAISKTDRTLIDCGNIVIDDFEKIFVIGYPYGWYDQFNNLPVARIGHLSSPFKIPFQGRPMMMGDVITHEGMSGGPVFMRLNNYVTRDNEGRTTLQLGHSRTLLVGINSGQFTINEDCRERPNLIVIWFPEMILEILSVNGL
jgi:hypothetical protein